MPPCRLPAFASLSVALALCTGSHTAQAGSFLHRHRCKPCVSGVCAEQHEIPYQHPTDPAAEWAYYSDYTLQRAGNPQCLSHHAAPSTTASYSGYAVGGGSVFCGGPRCAEEGTWGWDYVGGHLPRHVYLRWTHGRRYQAGTGAYKVDGPEVPNVFTLKLLPHHGEGPAE